MKNANLHIANASGKLTPHLQIIQAAFEHSILTCSKLFHLDSIDVVVTNEPDETVPDQGIGGFTIGKHLVYLPVDSSKQLSKSELYNTLCHELLHAKRYYGEGHGNTLFDMIVSEGLAVCFEEEVSDSKGFFPNYLKKQPYKTLLHTFAPKLDDTAFTRFDWFVDESAGLPRWAGYIVGYHIIKGYCQAKNKKASELALEPSRNIRQWFDDNKLSV